MLIGAHVSTAGGLAKAIERGTELGCESIQIFHQSPRMWRPTQLRRGGLRRLPRGDGRLAGRSGGDPRRLPDQLRDQRRGAAQEVARLAHPRAADRRRRSAPPASSSTPGAQKGEPLGPSMKRAAKVIAAALKDSDALPAAARADRRPQRPARPRLRPDRGADRAWPAAASGSASASTPATSSSRATTSPTRAHLAEVARRSRRQGRPRAPALPPRQRRRRPARLLPRPPRQRRQGRDGQEGPRRLPLRAALRGPAGDPGDAGAEEERPRPQRSHGPRSASAKQASSAAADEPEHVPAPT